MLNVLRIGCLVKTVGRFGVTSCWLWLAGALICSSWSAGQALAAEDSLTPKQLRCEYLVNPPGIDEMYPRLSWVVESGQRGQRQTAYQILVASDETRLRKDQGDLWDSGKVASSETTGVVYGGKGLTSRQRCFWKVKVWDKAGKPSAWSERAMWSMALLKPGDWKAQYISFSDKTPLHRFADPLLLPPARQYRKEFARQTGLARLTGPSPQRSAHRA